MSKRLSRSFYLQADVVKVARELLGKVLVNRSEGIVTAGVITETEAYAGEVDRASHAFGGRRTKRNEVMYAAGGFSYVYLCYGMHQMFNVVSNKQDVPHAVLVRAVHPIAGIDVMAERRRAKVLTTNGPGKVTQALGIHSGHNAIDLTGDVLYIEDRGIVVPDREIITGPRIGVDYAGDDALLPYRFLTRIDFPG
jgi:DNA-3-methyladenine glycosylase